MTIKPVSRYVYDIFIDKGWDQWLRVRKNVWGLSSMNNIRIDKEFAAKLEAALIKFPNGCDFVEM